MSKKEPYTMREHSFVHLSGVGKSFCVNCGLIALNNPLSEWASKKGCNHTDHPEYEATVKRLTKMKWS